MKMTSTKGGRRARKRNPLLLHLGAKERRTDTGERKRKKKNSRYSGPCKFSGDELASVHSSRIGPGVSTTDLIAWAEKKYSFFVKELINEEKQVIITLRKDLEKVRDAVIKFGDISSDRIAYIENKLYKLTKLGTKNLIPLMSGMLNARCYQRPNLWFGPGT